jgi:hypothetical protein
MNGIKNKNLLAYLWVQVEELEKEILDSRQKIEFYHVKMQELVSTLAISFSLCESQCLLHMMSFAIM